MKSFFELKKLVIGPSDLNSTFHCFFDLMDNPLIANSGELITKYETKHTPEIKALLYAVTDITSRFVTYSFMQQRQSMMKKAIASS